MKTDDEIDRERAELAKHIGPTKAEWYAEACRIEKIGEDRPRSPWAWPCRYQELARQAGTTSELLRKLILALSEWEKMGCPYASEEAYGAYQDAKAFLLIEETTECNLSE